MTIKIQWTTKAIENIEEIYEFYASKNERAAVDLYNTIITATEPLKNFPGNGTYRTSIGRLSTSIPFSGCQKEI